MFKWLVICFCVVVAIIGISLATTNSKVTETPSIKHLQRSAVEIFEKVKDEIVLTFKELKNQIVNPY